MTEAEKVTALEEARELIAEALVLIREATEGDAYVENYLCASLSLIVAEGVYVSQDVTIDWIIERIEKDGPDEDDDDMANDNNDMADIDDGRGRGHMGKGKSDPTLPLRDISHKTGAHHCSCCGRGDVAVQPCPECGKLICQDCAPDFGGHVCDLE